MTIPSDLEDLFEDPDDDIADLLEESLALVAEESAAKRAKKKLADGRVSPTEREELRALVAEYDEKRMWESVAQVALIHVQACTSCGHTAQMFKGWMVEQQHRTVTTTRRLQEGESPLKLPLRIERHTLKPRAQCVHCLEAYIRERQSIIVYNFPQRRIEKETPSA